MATPLLLATAVRWVGFVALATLVGSLVLDVVVLPREASDLGGARRRLARLGVLCLIVLVGTTAGELLARAQTMAGGDVAAAVSALPAVLTRTHFGAIWIGRLVALAAALLIASATSRAARPASLFLALAVTLTTTLTGHAADWGDLTATAAIDWVHVVAVSTWTGGLIALALMVLPHAGAWADPLFGTILRRFSRLAGLCLLAALASGGYNAWVQLSGVSELWTTFYGRVLSLKLLVVLGLIGWGAVVRYTIVARLEPGQRVGAGARLFRLARLIVLGSGRVARRALPSRTLAYVRREAVLVLLVFGLTAVLVDSTPARHDHPRHQAIPEPGTFRVTMEELHRRGGVPEGWIFVPPPGDATHGREVFVRLRCHACHRVKREKFPASSRPGPDLTGVGEHHPAGYILESIVNPNAVIVDGTGYTGPDGRSIMPDYRGELSVTDLIDLVAYLKTL